MIEFGTRVWVSAVAYRVTANASERYVETEAPCEENGWKELKRQGLDWVFTVAKSQRFGGITGDSVELPAAHEHLLAWPGRPLPESDEELPKNTSGDGYTRIRRFDCEREGVVLGQVKRTEGTVWSGSPGHFGDDWENGGSHALRTVDLLVVALEPYHQGAPVAYYAWPDDVEVRDG